MKNKKGFTLIEIIVSLMIASIAMIIATTLILNSMGYFSKTAVSDHDKQALDGIKSYFQDELIYASEARISTKKPDDTDWHWLYVKDGVLYRDDEYGHNGNIILDDVVVYNNDFYNSRILKIDARTFGEYRIDLKFSFSDKKDVVYKTSTTIEMLNFSKNISDSVVSIKDDSKTLDGTYRLYYKKESLNYEKAEPYTGTVADQMGCIDESILNDETKEFKELFNYSTGDFAFKREGNKKVWYMCLAAGKYTTGEFDGQQRLFWKRLEAGFSVNSGYLVGDIVVKDGIYYECIKDIYGDSEGSVQFPENLNNWKRIDKPVKANKKCNVIPTKQLPVDYTVSRQDSGNNWANVYEKKSYIKNERVNYKGDANNPKRTDLWKKVYNDNETVEPGTANSKKQYTWRDYSLDWKEYNGYFQNDVIRFDDDNFYQAKKDVIDGTPPVDANGKVSDKWQKVKILGSGTNSTWVIDDSK